MPEVATKRRDTLVMVGAAGLIGVGLWLGLRGVAKARTKAPGDKLTATIKFGHRGRAEEIWAGFGYAKAQALGFGDITDFTYITSSVEVDEDWEPYQVEVEGVVPVLPEGKYDLFVFLQRVGGALRRDGEGFIIVRWYPDRLTIA